MKKIIALFMFAICNIALASPIVVPIVWPFAAGSNQANYVRAIIDQANSTQDKYLFIYENKPGAGGSIAANYVLNRKGLTVFSTPSSFYLRPIFYPDQSYNINDFQSVLTQCTGLPYALVSTKFKTFEELKKQKNITVGSILGHSTEAMARELRKKLPNTEIIIVGYNSTSAGTKDVLGGNLDLNIDLAASALQWVENGKLNVIGSSGTIDHKNFITFSTQGINGFEPYIADYQLLVAASVATDVVKELHDILYRANQTARGAQLYAKDYCVPAKFTLEQSQKEYKRAAEYWKKVIEK
jgi:tripartite-type tricarboxylate transporter receptor subunit TctC